MVCSAALRRCAFTLLKTSSIGLRSGEYGSPAVAMQPAGQDPAELRRIALRIRSVHGRMPATRYSVRGFTAR